MRILQSLGLVGIVVFVSAAFTPLPNALTHRLATPPRLERAQAIVVLGGGIERDGTLSDISLRRMIHGVVLYRQGLAPLLVFLGEARNGGPAEAEVRAALAREVGVSSAVILPEAGARTSREEAVRIEVALRPRGIRRILLVTDSQHMARAQAVFERSGFEVLAAPTDNVSADADKPEKRLQLVHRVIEEFFGRAYYSIARFV